jgi:predicted ArsR family transcriptional regulator
MVQGHGRLAFGWHPRLLPTRSPLWRLESRSTTFGSVENSADWSRGPRVGRAARRLSPARVAVLARLRGQPEPVTLAALLQVTGLHENTVREHLWGLVRAGYVRRHRTEPAGRGRPAWLYECTDTDPTNAEYAGLAASLARAIVNTSDDPAQAAAIAGEAWGHQLARDRGAVASTPEVARRRVVEVLDDLGFEPEVDDRSAADVRLTRCPLLEVAYRHTDVVCAVHLGLARGVLDEHGAESIGTQIYPFSEPHSCLLVIPPLDKVEG